MDQPAPDPPLLDPSPPTIAVLGAAGLIGQAIASDLARAGWAVLPIARRFTPAQRNGFAGSGLECPIAGLDTAALAQLLAARRVDIIVNCIGVLQDGGRDRTEDVHHGFVGRLVEALATLPGPPLLIHLSIPGRAADDTTAFARTKRAAEQRIASAARPFVILRPGFVVAPAAYGGSALIRALAALPLRLSRREAGRPFAATAITDITATIALVARRWQAGERRWAAIWDVMERRPATVAGVLDAFRRRFGGPAMRAPLPGWLLAIGAGAGDLAARLGWRPPIRGTALREMRRGVAGDPAGWIAATGIEPASLDEALARLPATVQEGWFARLYLLKAAIIATLTLFWSASGLIALTIAFTPARTILTSHGFPPEAASAATILSSLCDITVGLAIAVRRTCRPGLLAGIAVALGYMAGSTLIAPDLWIEPLGALVKTGPAILLMLVGLAILDER